MCHISLEAYANNVKFIYASASVHTVDWSELIWSLYIDIVVPICT